MTQSEPLRCPVCRARFRQQRECSRCGADLSRLMRLAGQAHRLRERGRQALRDGNTDHAQTLVLAAQHMHHTAEGDRLGLLAGWLLDRAAQEVGDEPEIAVETGPTVASADTEIDVQSAEGDVPPAEKMPARAAGAGNAARIDDRTGQGRRADAKPDFKTRSLAYIRQFINRCRR